MKGSPTYWQSAADAVATGQVPCSAGEGRILLIAASIAKGVPLDLGEPQASLDWLTCASRQRAWSECRSSFRVSYLGGGGENRVGNLGRGSPVVDDRRAKASVGGLHTAVAPQRRCQLFRVLAERIGRAGLEAMPERLVINDQTDHERSKVPSAIAAVVTSVTKAPFACVYASRSSVCWAASCSFSRWYCRAMSGCVRR